ncbi:hypothetical protein AMECASPLE_027379, partial [Ameca splendens]
GDPPGLSGVRHQRHTAEDSSTDCYKTGNKMVGPSSFSTVTKRDLELKDATNPISQSPHPVEKAEPIQGQGPEEIARWNCGVRAMKSKFLTIIFTIGSILFLGIGYEYLEKWLT